MKKTRMIAAAAVAALSASALAVAASAFNGYLGFQTGNWCYRNSWDDAKTGKATEFFGCVIMNGGAAEQGTYPDYEDYYEADLGTYAIPVKFTDVEITGAGTYTVAIEGFDWSLDGSQGFNGGWVTTDIKESDGLECTSVTVYIDGKAEKTFDTPNTEYTQAGYLQINWSNPWNDLGAWPGSYPTKELKVEFTLASAAKDGDAAPATTTAAPTTGDTQAATDSSKGSPDTGVADVAVIGGLALAAGAGIVLTRKRK